MIRAYTGWVSLTASLVFCFGLQANAYQDASHDPESFFRSLTSWSSQFGQAGDLAGDLKDELEILLHRTHTNRLNYKMARTYLMGQLHLEEGHKGYFIRDVYCLKEFSANDFRGTRGPQPNKVPDERILNVEHTWPQSRFGGGTSKSVMKSDLHHLFPTDSEMNAKRGNFKFGEIDGPEKDLKCRASHFGDGRDGRPRFEPPDSHKGNVARALFYFSVRYHHKIDSDEEAILRQWHLQDPVDADELQRNSDIADIQGNRNPFIDQPEYVGHIQDF